MQPPLFYLPIAATNNLSNSLADPIPASGLIWIMGLAIVMSLVTAGILWYFYNPLVYHESKEKPPK
jgi:hypothetical protein